MKISLQLANRKYWISILAKFVSVQLLVQVLGFCSGLLLIRSLSKQDYAYFTLANSMQGTMNVLADSGLSTALSGIGGKIWQDRYRFGQLINTAIRLRKYLGAIVVLIITPVLLWTLYDNGASVIYAIGLTVAVLVELNFYLTNAVFLTVPKLHSQISRIQRLDFLFAGFRLLTLGVAYFTFLNAFVAVSVSTIGTILQRITLQNWVSDTIDIKAPINKNDQETIIAIMKPQVPLAIFYCFQGQLTIWLITFFGNAEKLAEVGVLGRLIVVLSILNTVLINIFIPSFARSHSRILLLKKYLTITGIYCCISLFIVFVVALFPNKVIFVLGDQYSHLKEELLLSVISTLFIQLVGVMWLLNTSKAWIQNAWLHIPLTLIFQIPLVFIINVSTVKGVILFSMLSQLPSFFLNAYITFNSLKKIKD